MDIWEVLRVGGRRWWVLLPVLLVFGAITVVLVRAVDTDYRASAEFVVLGPNVGSQVQEGGQIIDTEENPYLFGDGSLMARTLTLRLHSNEVEEALRSEGLSTSYELVADNRAPIVYVDVVGDTSVIADATARRLVELAVAEVTRLQDVVEAPPTQRITLSDLAFSAPSEDTGPVRLAGAGLGLLTLVLAFGAALLVESRLRRIARRQAELDTDDEPAEQSGDLIFADRLVSAIEARLAASPSTHTNGSNGNGSNGNGATTPPAEEGADDASAPTEVKRGGRWGNR